MALLAQARLYDEARSPEERRRCCIEVCDALEKHSSMLRQLIGVEAAPMMRAVEQSYEVMTRDEKGGDDYQPSQAQVEDDDDDDDIEVPSPKARLKAKVAPGDVDALFGG